jgi:hypothetical protein
MSASIVGKISAPARNHWQTGLGLVGIGGLSLFHRAEFSTQMTPAGHFRACRYQKTGKTLQTAKQAKCTNEHEKYFFFPPFVAFYALNL